MEYPHTLVLIWNWIKVNSEVFKNLKGKKTNIILGIILIKITLWWIQKKFKKKIN